ncbi:MAG: DUF84 family protein [Bacillota bacterium]|nr:DUF84 family protein [Bacillota bacterium]
MRKARIEHSVRFRDTDAQGIMYYGEYFTLFEMGRMEVFRQALGLDLEREKNISRFAVAKAQCQYRKPVRLGQKVYLESFLKEMGRSSLHFAHRLYGIGGDLLAEGDDVTVQVGPQGTSSPLDPRMRQHLQPFLLAEEEPPLQVVLGSTNRGKKQAVWEALWKAGEAIRLQEVAVPGLDPLPWGDEAIQQGATRRALKALEIGNGQVGLGLESGLVERKGTIFVVGWCAAITPTGQEAHSRTVEVPLPEEVAQRLRQGENLERIIDDLWGVEQAGEKGGAMAFATSGLVTREEAWKPAIWAALAPLLGWRGTPPAR